MRHVHCMAWIDSCCSVGAKSLSRNDFPATRPRVAGFWNNICFTILCRKAGRPSPHGVGRENLRCPSMVSGENESVFAPEKLNAKAHVRALLLIGGKGLAPSEK